MKHPFIQIQPDGTKGYHCALCNDYYPESKFFASSILRSFHRCRSCILKGQEPRPPVKLSTAEKWIRRLRRLSGQRVYVEPADLERIAQECFQNQSMQSGKDEDLVMTRLFPTQPVTLDNLICLTRAEAHQLESVQDPLKLYSPSFIDRVQGVLGA